MGLIADHRFGYDKTGAIAQMALNQLIIWAVILTMFIIERMIYMRRKSNTI